MLAVPGHQIVDAIGCRNRYVKRVIDVLTGNQTLLGRSGSALELSFNEGRSGSALELSFNDRRLYRTSVVQPGLNLLHHLGQLVVIPPLLTSRFCHCFMLL